MKNGEIKFVGRKTYITPFQWLNKFEFKSTGRFRWLQRLAWSWLCHIGAVKHADDLEAHTDTYTINVDKFTEQLLKERYDIMENWRGEPVVLFIGSEDFQKLMKLSRSVDFPMSFLATFERGDPWGYSIYGMQVVLVPWMKGHLLLPEGKVFPYMGGRAV